MHDIHHEYVYTCILCACSLLLYGMLCCLDERYPEAGEFFELATTADPTNVMAWTMRGTYTYNIIILCTMLHSERVDVNHNDILWYNTI